MVAVLLQTNTEGAKIKSGLEMEETCTLLTISKLQINLLETELPPKKQEEKTVLWSPSLANYPRPHPIP